MLSQITQPFAKILILKYNYNSMSIKALKYLLPLTIYYTCWLSFSLTGWVTWLPMIYAWVAIPFAELFIHPNTKNLTVAEEELARHNKLYDNMLYAIVLAQYVALAYFLYSFKISNLLWWEKLGRVFSMGLLCGTFGINVGHELGHRVNKFEQFLAKSLLLTSLYMHFFMSITKGIINM